MSVVAELLCGRESSIGNTLQSSQRARHHRSPRPRHVLIDLQGNSGDLLLSQEGVLKFERQSVMTKSENMPIEEVRCLHTSKEVGQFPWSQGRHG